MQRKSTYRRQRPYSPNREAVQEGRHFRTIADNTRTNGSLHVAEGYCLSVGQKWEKLGLPGQYVGKHA
jgi:hypothetical protein